MSFTRGLRLHLPRLACIFGQTLFKYLVRTRYYICCFTDSFYSDLLNSLHCIVVHIFINKLSSYTKLKKNSIIIHLLHLFICWTSKIFSFKKKRSYLFFFFFLNRDIEMQIIFNFISLVVFQNRKILSISKQIKKYFIKYFNFNKTLKITKVLLISLPAKIYCIQAADF